MKATWSIFKDLSIPIIIMGVGTFLGSWLLIQYQRPQIVYYTDGYYSRLGDVAFGSIFIVNQGRTAETNFSLLLNETISATDVSVNYVSSQAIVNKEGSRTRITIPKIKPNESAEVVFRSRFKSGNFQLEEANSDSGNVRHEEWIRPWWSFTKLQIGIILLIVTAVFGMGFAVGLLKNDLFTKRTKR